jgi:hypothetical protein
MARFSQAFLQGLLQPTYQQGLFEAARGLGQTPGIMRMQRREEEEKKREQALALTTYNQMAAKAGLTPEEASTGVRGLISGEYKDPTTALKETVELKDVLSSKKRRTYISNQLQAEGLEDVAQDVEAGIYTDAQLGSILSNARQAKAAAEQGQAGLEAFVTASGLTNTVFGKAATAGNLQNVSPTLIGKLATEALQDKETQALITNLKKMGTDAGNKAAELLDLGVITPAGARKIVEESGEPTKISTADMKLYYVEGVGKVWGGDITVGNVERRAYRDPNDPNKIIDLPTDAREVKDPETGKESRIRDQDLTIASIELMENPLYSDLSTVDQQKAQLAFASKYNTLLNQKKTNEEALAEAKKHTLSLIGEKEEDSFWWFLGAGPNKVPAFGVPEFATVEEANAAGLEPGTKVTIGGRPAEIIKDENK